jgi:MFS family permease
MFKRIYTFYFSYWAAMSFSQALIVFWLSKNGLGFSDIVIFFLITYLVALVGIFLLDKIKMKTKPSFLLGVLLSALSIAVLMHITSIWQVYLSAVIGGFNIIFFWIPYNIVHFKFSHEKRRGLNSGAYFLISPIIGITLQPLAGMVAEKFGFETMFLIGLAMYLLPIFLIKYLPNFDWNLDIRKEFFSSRFNWSTFFQGFTSRINWALIPIFTLFFIKTPQAFGNFFGYLAVLAAVVSLVNAHFSDKIKSRKLFYYLFSSLVVVSFLPLAFIHNIYYWVIFAGINSICMYLANPFWLAFNLDYYKELGVEKSMILREVFLDLGYSAILLMALFVFYLTSSPKMSLIIVSLLACLLPIVSYLQKVYLKPND